LVLHVLAFFLRNGTLLQAGLRLRLLLPCVK